MEYGTKRLDSKDPDCPASPREFWANNTIGTTAILDSPRAKGKVNRLCVSGWQRRRVHAIVNAAFQARATLL